VGDLGGGVKAQGSGDAGLAGQAQAGQTSHGLFALGREPNSRSGAVTTVTLAKLACTRSFDQWSMAASRSCSSTELGLWIA
jgi:hypothetical protein